MLVGASPQGKRIKIAVPSGGFAGAVLRAFSEMDPLSLTSFLTDFAAVADPRLDRRKQYPLLEILLLCVAAGISGYQEWEAIADFGRLKLAWLRQYLPYANGIPSHDTVNRVMGLLDLRQVERCLVQWSTRTVVLPSGAHLCFDGKCLRRSVTAHQAQTAHAQGGRTAVTLLHAWCDEAGLCLGQYETERKVNEPRVLPDLLALLDVRGCVVSADAGFTQPATAAALTQAGADYVLALKRRQQQLYAATQAAFAQASTADCWDEPAEKPRHARHETRRCRVLPASVLSDALRGRWPRLQALVEVQTTRTPTKPMPHTPQPAMPAVQTRYYLTSLAVPAATLLGLVRRHWGIENRLHWVLDVVLGEDQSRKRAGQAAANYAAVRKLVLRLLQALPEKISFQRKLNQCALSDDYRHKCLRF